MPIPLQTANNYNNSSDLNFLKEFPEFIPWLSNERVSLYPFLCPPFEDKNEDWIELQNRKFLVEKMPQSWNIAKFFSFFNFSKKNFYLFWKTTKQKNKNVSSIVLTKNSLRRFWVNFALYAIKWEEKMVINSIFQLCITRLLATKRRSKKRKQQSELSIHTNKFYSLLKRKFILTNDKQSAHKNAKTLQCTNTTSASETESTHTHTSER